MHLPADLSGELRLDGFAVQVAGREDASSGLLLRLLSPPGLLALALLCPWLVLGSLPSAPPRRREAQLRSRRSSDSFAHIDRLLNLCF